MSAVGTGAAGIPRPGGLARVACIDIGTVTCRLAVAEVAGGVVVRMLKQSAICNLGEGLTQTGAICSAAARRVLDCVDQYLALAQQAGAQAIACTLTSAARDASNSDDLLAQIARRGLRPQVIAGNVEGSLTFLGVAQDFPGARILVADNGGGSTELAVGSLVVDASAGEKNLRLDRVHSVDVGCRRVTEKFLLRNDLPSAADLAEAREFAGTLFSAAIAQEGIVGLAPERLVMTGGTVTSLVAVRDGLVPYDSRRVHLNVLSRDDVEGMVERLAGLTESGRAKLPGLQPKRAGVILGGAIAVAALLEETGFSELTVSESDLLFGLSICSAAVLAGAAAPFGW